MAGVPGFGPARGGGAPVGHSPGPAAWIKAHPAQTAGGVGAAILGAFLLRKKTSAGSAGGSAAAGAVPTQSTADTTATDLYNQIQPEIDRLGGEVGGLQAVLAGSTSAGSSSTTSSTTGTDSSTSSSGGLLSQPAPQPVAAQPAPATAAPQPAPEQFAPYTAPLRSAGIAYTTTPVAPVSSGGSAQQITYTNPTTGELVTETINYG